MKKILVTLVVALFSMSAIAFANEGMSEDAASTAAVQHHGKKKLKKAKRKAAKAKKEAAPQAADAAATEGAAEAPVAE